MLRWASILKEVVVLLRYHMRLLPLEACFGEGFFP